MKDFRPRLSETEFRFLIELTEIVDRQLEALETDKRKLRMRIREIQREVKRGIPLYELKKELKDSQDKLDELNQKEISSLGNMELKVSLSEYRNRFKAIMKGKNLHRDTFFFNYRDPLPKTSLR